MKNSLLRSAAAMVVGLSAAAGVFAEDVIYMTNGDVWRGQITREGDNFIYIEYTIGSITQEKFLLRKDIDRVEYDSTAPGEDADAIASQDLPPVPPGAAKIAFITLEEMVGPYMNAKALEESVERLNTLPDSHKPDAVVLWIDSGGGALFELIRLNEYIHEELKPQYRTVSWIRSAISAAAMTAWSTNEIYMMPEGNIGACTGFRQVPGNDGQAVTVPMLGPELDEILEHMRQVSATGDHEPWVMWAMQIAAPHRPFSLSAEVDPVTGDVVWHKTEGPGGSLPGELISPHDEILTLNAVDAVRLQVAEGMAGSKDELARQMGFEEWVEVGFSADEHMQEFRDSVSELEGRFNELIKKLVLSLNLAGEANSRAECQKNIALAQRHLNEIEQLADQGHSVREYNNLNDEWFAYWQSQIDRSSEACVNKSARPTRP